MRIALGVEYDGTHFYGWQAQQDLVTVQGELQHALTKVAGGEPIQLHCAGRTDAGVHAIEQVVHFDTPLTRELKAWTLGTNTHLPSNIVVKWAKNVSEDFHARFSATARRYQYIIYNHPIRSAIHAHKATWFPHQLDVEAMQKASEYLIGEHDFSSLRSSNCDSKSPMRNVHYLTIKAAKPFIHIEIQANAFLHHMVRNIVGVLTKIGAGKEPYHAMERILLAKDRRAAFETAPPDGLYLAKVIYPDGLISL